MRHIDVLVKIFNYQNTYYMGIFLLEVHDQLFTFI